MAAADILKILGKYDLSNITEDARSQYYDEERQWSRNCTDLPGPVTLWYDATKILMSKICIPNMPRDDHDAVFLAKHMIELVFDQSRDGNYQAIEYENLYGLFYDMLIRMVELGPGIGHAAIWSAIFHNGDFKEYYMKLPKEKICKMLNSLKKEYYYNGDSDDPESNYTTRVQSALEYVVDRAVSEEMMKSNHEDFLDLFMFYLTNFLKSDEPIYNMTHSLAMKIWYKFGRTPFKRITNPEIYRKYLKLISDCLHDKDVPNDEKRVKELVSNLKYILNGIEEEKLFPDLYIDLVDFVLTMCNKTTGLPPHEFIESIGYLWFHTKEDIVKNKTVIFDGMAPKIAKLLENLSDYSICELRLIKPALYNILGPAMNNSKEHAALWIRIVTSGIHIQGCAEAMYYAVREQEKFLKWKNYPSEAKNLFQCFSKVNKITYEAEKKRESTIGYYENFLKYFLEQVKKAKLIPDLLEELLHYSLKILEDKNEEFYRLAEVAADYFDGLVFKKHREIAMEAIRGVTKLLRDESEWNIRRCCALQELACNALESITDCKSLTSEDFDVLVDLCDASLSGDFIIPDGNIPGTEYYRIYVVAVFKTFKLLSDSGDVSKAKNILAKVLELIGHDEDSVADMASTQIFIVGQGKGGADCLAAHLPQIIDLYLDKETYNLLSVIQQVYPQNDTAVADRFQELFASIESGDSAIRSYCLQLLTKVAGHQPKLFTKENVDTLMEVMFEGDPNEQLSYIMVIDLLVEKNTKIIYHILDDLMNKEYSEYTFYHLHSILRKIAVKSDEKTAERIVNRFIKVLSGPEHETNTMLLISELRGLVATHKPLVNKHKQLIVDLKERTSNQNIRDTASGLIDLLEGRSLETLAVGIDQQQDDIENLDTRVTTNEITINTVTEEVGKQKEDIIGIKYEVNEQGQRINVLGEVVEETVLKVEEIDQKTLSHAPYWSRDVSKLMNPQADCDWRLLSSRLGYSNDDIRAWAQQSDPCMAMLNEWYATHKTSEASYGVLIALQEMDRMDAAIIVENAMKAAEQVVEEEEFEYATPPPIFLSYQWSHQEEVKLLRKHLEMAGYECWMDIGQMGGGDKLFEKIDTGIRAAKVIISCTTEKYAKSPNCNREVNLAVNLRKPIIPLLLENCAWPPPGSMGPIFSEYLYIQFFQRDTKEATPDDRYWPIPKFQELLMQLSMNGIVPDESKVENMYKNWWMPLVEEIKIDKSNTAGGGKNKTQPQTTTGDKKDEKSPEVFISYQWDKQKNIMLLYRRLTELGYHCWMDIHQMGGGDSLYDKIDRGIRGCRVVLSCITEKYALSANCRREVSLCDALKRPIIPLLLENTTWPPRGPMSMAFTELLYIDFHSEPVVQEKWSGPKFEEMRAKIRQILPDPDQVAVDYVPESKPKSKSEPKSEIKQNETKVMPEKKQPEPEGKPTKPADDTPAKKTSYVKSATPGTKTVRPIDNLQPVAHQAAAPADQSTQYPKVSKESSPDKSGSESPSVSPAYTGSPRKPKPVRPLSGSTKKTSKPCSIL
ncbi:uncharacterized protein LOC126817928 [Patella vulgata]|uniref:uncharacterized protein LOC126817928 n=1 Tax=Patella vulgata TaxID=6465 RepID=UPI0024A896F9|nr:uncharacterized protein LOC126817928 [Patella vulgata]